MPFTNYFSKSLKLNLVNFFQFSFLKKGKYNKKLLFKDILKYCDYCICLKVTAVSTNMESSKLIWKGCTLQCGGELVKNRKWSRVNKSQKPTFSWTSIIFKQYLKVSTPALNLGIKDTKDSTICNCSCRVFVKCLTVSPPYVKCIIILFQNCIPYIALNSKHFNFSFRMYLLS